MKAEAVFWKLTRWARAARFWFFLVAALLAVAGLGTGEARAGTLGCAAGPDCDKGQAYQACHAHLTEWLTPERIAQGWTENCRDDETNYYALAKAANGNLLPATIRGDTSTGATRYFYHACPADKPWNEETKKCEGNECLDKPPLTNLAVRKEVGLSGVCVDGCSYDPDTDFVGGEKVRILGTGANRTIFASTWRTSGQQCQTENPHDAWNGNKPICEVLGDGSKNCAYPNGDQCNVAGDVVMCWGEGQTGPRHTQDGSVGADRQVPPNQPQPPSNMNNPTPGGTSNTTINNNSYTTTNYTGTPGTGPGQGNVGDGGTDPTDPSGGGTKPGAGSGDGEGEGDDPGDPGAGVGELYEGTQKTVASVYAEFKADVEGAPLVNVAENVFGGCGGGGACPQATWTADEWGIVQDLSMLCGGDLLQLITWAGYVGLAGMMFFAFKVAIL